MNGSQFEQIGMQVFGAKYRQPMSNAIGLSYARVAQLVKADTIPVHIEQKVLELAGKPMIVQTAPTVYGQVDPDAGMSDAEILARIEKRFSVMLRMVDGMIMGSIPSMIVSGAPGVGKTFNLEKKIRAEHEENGLDYSMIRGTCSAPGLYQALYYARNGGIVVLDDCDSIFNDEQAFNILKSALDTGGERVIAWRKNSSWVYNVRSKEFDDDATENGDTDKFPNEFVFKGSCVFITNLDMKAKAAVDNKMGPHFRALVSRSTYIDLAMKSTRARVLWIKHVFMGTMRQSESLSVAQATEILDFVFENKDRLQELSLRMVKHVCQFYKIGSDWRELVEETKMNG